MFNQHGPGKAPDLQELYDLMLALYDKTISKFDAAQVARKKILRQNLRGAGMLSLPFSLNCKKFKPL